MLLPVAYLTNKANVMVCSSKSPVGGVVGSIAGAAGNDLIKVTGCANSGEISGTQANNQVGGIVGRATIDTEISQSYILVLSLRWARQVVSSHVWVEPML